MNYANIKSFLFENTTAKQTIFKNTFWQIVGNIFNKLFTFALAVYAARILGVEDYGKFTFAVAFISLLMVFADFGLSTIIIREFVRKEEKEEEFYSIISLKIILSLIVFILILVASFFAPGNDIQKIILILSFFFLINGFIAMCYSFFHACQKMEYEAWLEIIQVLLIFGFSFFVLFRFPSVENLSYAYSISSLIALIFVFLFFHYKVFHLKIEWNFSIWKKFLRMSWPLALTGLFGVIYGYTDSVMLGFWEMFTETGWYNAAQRIMLVGLLPMGLIGGSFYPALSKFSKESKEKFQKAWNYELEIMILIALPLVVGGIALARKIILFFYPLEFYPSVLAFQILILTAGIILLYRPFYDAMIVLNQQIKTFLITAAGAVTNVILNLILIPKYTLYGAAVATVITNFLILLIIIFFAKKFTTLKTYNLKILFTFLISALASFLMYSFIRQEFLYRFNIFLLIFLGAAVYFIVFFIFRKYILLKYFKQIYG